MTCVEAAESAPRARRIQIFATDLNAALLERARHGLYGKAIAQELSPERLRRFFVEEEGGYRVVKPLREMVVFARQNLIGDPPFSRMDLISCRNLLIYLEPGLQKELLPLFHYALKPGGYLMLGASESIGPFRELFEPVDKKRKIYAKKPAVTPAFRLPARRLRGESPHVGPGEVPAALRRPGPEPHEPEGFHAELNAQREADRVTVNQFAPPAVLVNAELQVLQFRGATGAYLEPPAGKASFDLLKMAREGLMLPLRAALQKAKKENKVERKEHVRVQQNGKTGSVNLTVIPLKNLRERCFLVLFDDAEPPAAGAEPAPRAAGRRKGAVAERRSPRERSARRIVELESELEETRDYVRAVEEQSEAANEELQAANEEVQSANEELQSINEELETSKEELESANEELTTLNEEMSHRNAELSRLNADLVNVQTATAQSIVLVGRDLTIRRFSARAEKQFDLLAADVGAPLSRIRHALGMPDVEALVRGAIDGLRSVEREVQDGDGHWFSLRVSPYLTLDDRVDGAVLLLVDIEDLKRAQAVVAAARDYADGIVDTVREPLLVLDRELRVERANAAFYRTFRATPEESVGRVLYDLGNGHWSVPRLRELLGGVASGSTTVEDFLVEHEFEGLGRRSMLLNARRVLDASRELVLLAIEDVTDRQRAERQLQQSVALLEERAAELDRFNRVAVGRELRMIELKREVNELCERHGEAARYPLDSAQEPPGPGGAGFDGDGGSRGVAEALNRELRASEARQRALTDELATELAAAQRLQEVSGLLIQGGDLEALYARILAAAVALMGSNFASLQRLDAERNELRLLAHLGFVPEAAGFWERVGLYSASSCGASLRAAERVVVPDIDACD